jgi:hypothetical protein
LVEQLAEPFAQGAVGGCLGFEAFLRPGRRGEPGFDPDALVGGPYLIVEATVDGGSPHARFNGAVEVSAGAEGDDAAEVEAGGGYCLPGICDSFGVSDDDPTGQRGVGGEKAGTFVGVVAFGQPPPSGCGREAGGGEDVPYGGDVLRRWQQSPVAERVEGELVGAGSDGQVPEFRLGGGDRLTQCDVEGPIRGPIGRRPPPR